MTLQAIPFSKCDVMEGVCGTLVPNSAAKGLRIDLFVDPDIPAHVISDQVRLRQILFNLAGNAIKFTDNAGGQIGQVTLRAERVDDDADGRTQVRFTVRDTGIGLSPEAVAKLFRPFTQADQSTTRRFGGTGLGLSICKNLTDLIGGKIEVKSEEGVGSDFIVTLPFDKAHAEVPDEVDLSGLTVMCVLQHGTCADDIGRYLTARGASVSRVSKPDDVLDAMRFQKHIDLLIIGYGWDQKDIDALVASVQGAAHEFEVPGLLRMTVSHTERKGLVKEGLVVVVGHPLSRSDFYQGAALAAGLIKPEDVKQTPHFVAPKRKAPGVEEARAAGELLVLAEDNLTNQDVITRQLNVLGYACEVADNGLHALDKLSKGGYALLLTDLHMPEMDGYELTAAIRDMELDSTDHLPIVAITANALQGEDGRCIAAGMDDYLSKPVEMQKLKETLDKWVPLVEAEAPSSEEAAPSIPQEEPKTGKAEEQSGEEAVLETTYLQETFGDDPDLIRDILKDFVSPATAIVKEVDDAFANKDAAGVGSAAHKLKSSSRAVGANAMADLCFELEKAGKGCQWDLINELYPQLMPAFKQVRSYIEGL